MDARNLSIVQVSIPREEDLRKQRRMNLSTLDRRCSPPLEEEIATLLTQSTNATWSALMSAP